MTPEERREDRLRHFPTLLQRWRGGRAVMWELTISLKTLTIRIERKGVRGNLHVACIGPLRIVGPVRWDDCEIEVTSSDDGIYAIRDARAGFEVHAEAVEVAENRAPIDAPM